MNNKYRVLMIFGFHLAGVNYLVSDYLIPSLACMLIAFSLSVEMIKKSSRTRLMAGFGFSLILNLAIFFCGSSLMSSELKNLILKLAFLQSFSESGLLILLCSGKEECQSLLKLSGSFFLILCVLIGLMPASVLNHFLYSSVQGNGASALLVLCSEIFIPIILCSIVGILCYEMNIKKEPDHFFGSIK